MEPTAARIIQLKVGACDMIKIAASATRDTPTTIKEMAAVLRVLNVIRDGSPLERFKVP
jgi:hypothetical protein